jgi:hypothetical protein
MNKTDRDFLNAALRSDFFRRSSIVVSTLNPTTPYTMDGTWRPSDTGSSGFGNQIQRLIINLPAQVLEVDHGFGCLCRLRAGSKSRAQDFCNLLQQ